MVPVHPRGHGPRLRSGGLVGKTMTPEERLKRLYRLNGQLEHIKRQLGSAYSVLCSLTDRREDHARRLSTVYDDLRSVQNSLFKRYLAS